MIAKNLKAVKKLKDKLPQKEETEKEEEEAISVKERISCRRDMADFNTAFISRRGIQEINHNNFAFIEAENYACWALADGYEESGEAAQMIIDEIMAAFMTQAKFSNKYLKKILKNAEKTLNEKRRENSLLRDQITSLAVVLSDYNSIRVAYIGNVRVCHLMNGMINYKTKDHSVAQLIFDANKMGGKELRFHTRRNDLTRAIGAKKSKVQIEKYSIKLGKGDSILLSTVGAWEHFDERDIEIEYTKSDLVNDWVVNLEKRIFASGVKEIGNYTLVGIDIGEVAEESGIKKRRKFNYLLWIPVILIVILLLLVSVSFLSGASKLKKTQKNIHLYQNKALEALQKEHFSESIENYKAAIDEYDVMLIANENKNILVKKIQNSGVIKESLEEQKELINSKMEKISKLIKTQETLTIIDEKANNYNFLEALKICDDVMAIYQNIDLKDSKELIPNLTSELEEKKVKLQELKLAHSMKAEGDKLGDESQYQEAVIKYSNAKEIFLKYGDMKMLTEINERLETFSSEREKFIDTALLHENKAYDTEYSAPAKAIEHFNSAIAIYRMLENNNRVETLTDKMAKVNVRINEQQSKGDEMFAEALIFETSQNYDSAIKKLSESKEIYEAIESKESIKKVNSEIEKVTELKRKKTDISKAFSLEAKANDAFLEKDYTGARLLYNKSIAIFEVNKYKIKVKELNNKLYEVDGADYEAIGDLNIKDNQLAAAMSNYSKSIRKYELYGDETYISRVKEKHKTATADYSYNQAVTLEEEGRKLYKEKDYEEAYQKLTKSESYYLTLENYEVLEKDYEKVMRSLNKIIKKAAKKIDKKR